MHQSVELPAQALKQKQRRSKEVATSMVYVKKLTGFACGDCFVTAVVVYVRLWNLHTDSAGELRIQQTLHRQWVIEDVG